MSRVLVRVSVALSIVCLSGCAPGEERAGPESSVSDGGVARVARVGERDIRAADVRARMELDGLEADAALDSLVTETLLLAAAEKSGLSPDEEASRKADRVMVRTLLRDLEQTNEPSDVPIELVRADFEAHRERYQRPERRAATHLLAKADTPEARRLVADALRRARGADDPVAVFRAAAEDAAGDTAIEVVVEELPLMTPKASIEKPFVDALFAAKSTGLLEDPVKTTYGWHAIYVRDIEAGERRTLKDVERGIRERLAQQARLETLRALVSSLETEDLVRYETAVVDQVVQGPKEAAR